MKGQENIDIKYSKIKTIFEYLKHVNKTKYFLYYPRPSQKTNPRQFCFIFTNLLSITCFGLRPDHMVYS